MKNLRKHRYFVGYPGDNQVVYGKDKKDGSANYMKPMTLSQAESKRRKMPSKGAILIEVEELLKIGD